MRSTNALRPLAAVTAAGAAVAALLVIPSAGIAGASTSGARLMGVHMDDSSNTSTVQAAWKESLIQGELDASRRMDLVSTSPYGFGATFPSWRETWTEQNGSEPVINWTSAASTGHHQGRQGRLIADRANGLKAFGSPVMLEFAPGMDNPAIASTISTPANFKASWIHVHNIFAAHGASNVSFVWCPSASAWANGTAMQWYPGDQYVDEVCAQAPTVDPSVSFASEFAPFYAAAATMGKPLMIGSFGVSDSTPGAKAQWITAAYRALATTFTNIGAAIEDGAGAAAMTTSPDAESAWAAGVSQSALYTAPTVTLPTGPLVPSPVRSLLGAMMTKGNTTSEPAAWTNLETTSMNNVDMAQIDLPVGRDACRPGASPTPSRTAARR